MNKGTDTRWRMWGWLLSILVLYLHGERCSRGGAPKGEWFMMFARANVADCVNELRGGGTSFESYLKAAIYLVGNIWEVVLSILP